MATKSVNLYVDVSDAMRVLGQLEKDLSPKQYQSLMRYTLTDVGRKARTVVGRLVTEDYEVQKNWVNRQIGHPKMMNSMDGISVVIPIQGARGSIGMIYPIYGRRKTKRRIRARIVKSGITTLPEKMEHQGGNPPFVAGGVVYTRRTKKGRPIVRVVGIGVPQMPMNRSRDRIEKELLGQMEKSVTRHFNRLYGGGA